MVNGDGGERSLCGGGDGLLSCFEEDCEDLRSCLEEDCGGLLVNIAFAYVPNRAIGASNMIDVYECSCCGGVALEGSYFDGLNVYSCTEGEEKILFGFSEMPEGVSFIDGGSYPSPESLSCS